MTRKIVIYTNILVSALLSSHEDAATVKVLSFMLEGYVVPIISETIFQEYGDVLRRRRFGFHEEVISILLDEIYRKALIIKPVPIGIELPDNKDRPFLEAMLMIDDALLITGNLKHFPIHERIMTARQFVDSLKNGFDFIDCHQDS